MILLVNGIDTRRKKKMRDSGGSLETNSYKNLDMRGRIRKSFFVAHALDNLDSNTICSPISALLPIGKLALGAVNTSLDEMLEGIGVISQKKIKSHFKHLIAELRYLPGVKLDMASRLYISTQTRLTSSFESDTKEIFSSSAERVDFESPVITADKINAWVESQTSNMIHDMISPDEIDPEMSLIMINAIYFNGKWETPFKKIQTATFHTPTDVRRVNMMSVNSQFNYTDSAALNAQILKLPYTGGTAALVIILPKARNGLPLLLHQIKLAPEILDSALNSMLVHTVQATIPKFKLESEMDLRKMYEKVGIRKIFKQYESDLSGIVRDKIVTVSKAKQKAVIDVNERGTEAAAASSTTMVQMALTKTVKFKADHPFLFILLSNTQQLFAGTLVHPHTARKRG
ncbi:antichymotrypsin-2 isoform X1 [Pieris rapae]|uniref:antichymotrypsin-2 isoform X1 n=2 Tax=Pieris rapae TaxID=64459 RepID=UPI001E27B74A|nr:antichymotrypsin-2 isoform X1 [Pieris rapae]